MSTRSGIAIKNQNGTYDWIYCHSDGYIINGVGQMLEENYQTRDEIEQLLNLGDISWLGEVPEDPGDIWEQKAQLFQRKDESSEEFWARYDESIEKWSHYTLSYKSRGECFPAQTANSYTELVRMFTRSDREFLYIWDEKNGWRVKDHDRRLAKVADRLA